MDQRKASQSGSTIMSQSGAERISIAIQNTQPRLSSLVIHATPIRIAMAPRTLIYPTSLARFITGPSSAGVRVAMERNAQRNAADRWAMGQRRLSGLRGIDPESIR
jgi:hypothetical protein